MSMFQNFPFKMFFQAAMKNAALDSQREQHEQEIVRLKLKHQLELKVKSDIDHPFVAYI